MMTIEKYIAWLRANAACAEAVEWSAGKASFAACWQECQEPTWMLWLLDHLALMDDTRARLYAC